MQHTVAKPIEFSANGAGQSSDAYALVVDNLTAGYPGDRHALKEVSFRVKSGERIALIGPNGAGKSTLFKAIAGLIPFTTGSISVFERDCHSSHSRVGYVPQHNEIDWSFPVTVYDVIMMGRARHNRWLPWARSSDHQRVQELLKQLSLMPIAQRQIGELSGGQKRRVFIARALAQETQVLLMDEPFTGVDTAAEHEIMETLDTLTEEGITILLATHDMGKAANHFDKVALINRRLLAYGMPEAVMQPDVLRQAYGGALTVFRQGNETILIADDHGADH